MQRRWADQWKGIGYLEIQARDHGYGHVRGFHRHIRRGGEALKVNQIQTNKVLQLVLSVK